MTVFIVIVICRSHITKPEWKYIYISHVYLNDGSVEYIRINDGGW